MSMTGSGSPSITYKYPSTVTKRGQKNIVALTPRVSATNPFPHFPLDLSSCSERQVRVGPNSITYYFPHCLYIEMPK